MKALTIENLARPVLLAGAPLGQATAAMLLIHGRGASAGDILTTVSAFDDPRFAYLAPEAPGHTWYPRPFYTPLQDNEPYLSASLAVISGIMAYLSQADLPPERAIVLGFSQGACLTLEWAARNARRYGGIVGLSGGLVGPDELPRAERGSLAGSAVFLGCSDTDPHIPKYRVEQAADWLGHLGGAVTLRLYPLLGHTINEDEIDVVRGLMANLGK